MFESMKFKKFLHGRNYKACQNTNDKLVKG